MDWFGTEFWSAIAGAIVGATASAVPAYLLANRSSKEVLRRDQAERDEQDRLATYRIFALLDHISNHLLSIRLHLEEMYTAHPISNDELYPVQSRLLPMVGITHSDLIAFDDSNFYIFLKKSGGDLISEVRHLIRLYNSDINSILHYSEIRNKIQEFGSDAQGFTSSEDGTVSLELSREQYTKMQLLQKNAETLAETLLPSFIEDSQKAVRICLKFNAWASEDLQLENAPRLDFSRSFDNFPDIEEIISH